MRAAVLHTHGQDLAIEDLAPPELGSNDVRIRVDASGVCHTDLSFQKGWAPFPPPLILGHEGVGTVLEIGPQVTHVAVGQRVICSIVPVCDACWYCVHGQPHLCRQFGDLLFAPRGIRSDGTAIPGISGLGTFADELVVHQNSLVAVDTELPAEQLALIGCGVTTGVGAAINTARVEPGSTVAVYGCGGVGQSIVQGARIAGAARIVAVEPNAAKRATAERLGATDTIDPGDDDPIDAIRELTGGRGADCAFEAIGRPESILQTFNSARQGGTAVIVGMPRADATVTFPALRLMADDKRLLGCLFGSAHARRDIPRLVELAETGRLDLDAMVSSRIALDDINDALARMDTGDAIRTVLCAH